MTFFFCCDIVLLAFLEKGHLGAHLVCGGRVYWVESATFLRLSNYS